MPSNQGSEMLASVLDDVPAADIDIAAKMMWREVRAHPSTSSCFCPAVEVLCSLYEQGYRLVKVES